MPTQLPMMKVSCPCGYFQNKLCTELYTYVPILKQTFGEKFNQTLLYNQLKQNGFCRSHDTFYLNKCYGCNQCHAIRIKIDDFYATKSQRAVYKKNLDLVVTLKNGNITPDDENAFLYREYEYYHNQNDTDYKKKTLEEAKNILKEMNSGYDGIWNMEYRLNNKLVGVAILDVTSDENGNLAGLCSNYFYYDTSAEIKKRSLGTFSILQEIALCKEFGIPYYYLGLYLPDCRKMNYKAKFQPCEIFIDNQWVAYSNVNNDDFESGITDETETPLPPPALFYPDFEDVCFITDTIPLNILKAAYQQAIFPWFSEEAGEPVIWRSPDPRFVIYPENLHISKSIKKFLKHTPYTYTVDKCFYEVMSNCGTMKRKDQDGTWVGKKMLTAYTELHKQGIAHSFEVWHDGKLAGGFYGILLGSIFIGESMFTLEPDTSKSAFSIFAQEFFNHGGEIIDCQAYTDNMARYGAIEIPRTEYLDLLKMYSKNEFDFQNFCNEVYNYKD